MGCCFPRKQMPTLGAARKLSQNLFYTLDFTLHEIGFKQDVVVVRASCLHLEL
jgi:hypothetical protein